MNTDPIKNLKRSLIKACAKAAAAGQFPAVIRVESEITNDIDPLSWLAAQSDFPKFFWRSEDGGRILAYTGAAHVFTDSDRSTTQDQWKTLQQWLDINPSLRCWGGSSFFPRISGKEWSDFDAWAMHIPRIGLERDPSNARWCLVCQCILSDKDATAPQHLIQTLDNIRYIQDLSTIKTDIHQRDDTPSYEEWQRSIDLVLNKIKTNNIAKIVLARRLLLTMSRWVSPEHLMSALLGQEGYAFLYWPAPRTAFLGLSPELLYHRRRDRIDTFAIAGTRPRGETEPDDLRLKQELSLSTKDKLEHQQVVDMLSDKLKKLCVLTSKKGKSQILELRNQRHLFQRLRGRLLDGVNDEVILNTLHPTPAVCGVPTHNAMNILAATEPFNRGWYAGTIGWSSHSESEMAVAIRSCLIRDRQWYIYAGAGIVPGSKALAEWEEISLKMKNILDVIDEL
jgi:menaquinone-specific isochorismate synthase